VMAVSAFFITSPESVIVGICPTGALTFKLRGAVRRPA
jgi:hypothetical protein